MNAMPVPANTQEPSPAPLSQGSRIVNTFIAPSKTFTDFRRSASWWAPWLLITLVSLIFIYSMDRNVGFDQISKTELTKNARQMEQFDKLSPKDQANNMRFRTILTRVLAYGFPAFALIAWVVITAVLMGAFNFGAGASVSFKVAFAIVVYSSLPGFCMRCWELFHCLRETCPAPWTKKRSTSITPSPRIQRISWTLPRTNSCTAWLQRSTSS
jgi:hypothetical protein